MIWLRNYKSILASSYLCTSPTANNSIHRSQHDNRWMARVKGRKNLHETKWQEAFYSWGEGLKGFFKSNIHIYYHENHSEKVLTKNTLYCIQIIVLSNWVLSESHRWKYQLNFPYVNKGETAVFPLSFSNCQWNSLAVASPCRKWRIIA